jgi:hypothetical protein
VGKKEKLLEKAKRNPQALRFSEFETLMEQWGWVFRRQSGSHRLWYSPSGYRLPAQPEQSGTAKTYQVKQFLARLEEEGK